MTNRRASIKKLLVASGGLISLPYWAHGWTADRLNGNDLYSPSQQEALASLVDTIIPKGDFIGGLDVGVDKFLTTLLQDCYTPVVQNQIGAYLEYLNQIAQNRLGKSFSFCTQGEREGLCQEKSNHQEAFDLLKEETIRGFRTSQEVMTKYYDYKVMPGFYYGCVDIQEEQ